MKVLKKVFFLFTILVAIPMIVAIFIPKDFKVEREVLIEKPVSEVFNYVKYLQNQENYSKWFEIDPDMRKIYRGIDGTAGFVACWESENKDLGSGEQEIIQIIEDERIDYTIRFFEPFESTDSAFILTQKAGEFSTLVIWCYHGHIGYPMNLMLLFMNLDKMIGDDLEFGLNKLKKILEKA